MQSYARHEPAPINRTTLHNISYATYSNIRFAQPPVGKLQFRAPKDTSTELESDRMAPTCANATDCLISIPPGLAIAPGVEGASWGSEDCLFLTVKVPEGVGGVNVPVVYWL